MYLCTDHLVICAHITPEIKTIVNKYSKMAVIPGGLTKKLQPLDIARRDESVSGDSDYVQDDTFQKWKKKEWKKYQKRS